MKRKLGLALVMVLGSFCIYCTQSAMQGEGSGLPDASWLDGSRGMVPDAHAQSTGGACCTPAAPTFVPLAEGDVTCNNGSSFATTPVSVAGYTELVLYVSQTDAYLHLIPSFRATASSAWGLTSQSIPSGARLRVDGSDFRMVVQCEGLSSTVHWTVAGVQ